MPVAELTPLRALFRQALPVMVGQLAVMANGIVDSVMAGHADAQTLAAVAVGNAVYISLYVGLMGIILGLTPMASRLYGAGEHHKIGLLAGQSLWIAVALAVLGCTAMLFPDPLLSLAQTDAALELEIRHYLLAVAVGLPAALFFRVFHAVNQAISTPSVVMRIQIAMLALKIPLNSWLIWGGLGVPAMGAAGCGWSTAIVMWFACLSSLGLWVTEKRYARLKTSGVLDWPRWDLLKSLFMMGLPIGGAYLIEVTAFTMVAVLVARFGIEIVAGHQIVSNLTATAYMLPLSLANATTVLTAQQLGASNPERARLFVLTGLKTAVVCALVVVGFYALLSDLIIGAYTSDAGTRAIAFQLLPWILAYHLIDATQTLCAFALRAYGISTTPMLIYGVCLWGLGLGGGIILGIWNTPPLMAEGFWMASVGSLLVAGILLAGLLWRAMQRN